MDYKRIYDELINNAKNRSSINERTEKHHIIPRSLGGNDIDNIVKLTPREHFIAHWILWKIYKNKEMGFAFHNMTRKNKSQLDRYFNSRGYSEARNARARFQSEIIKNKWKNPDYRLKMTEQSKRNWENPEYRKKTSESIKNEIVWKNINEIISLRNEKRSYRYIANKFGVTHTTIIRIIKNHGKQK